MLPGARGRERVIAQAYEMGARIQAALRRRTAPPRVEPPEPYELGDLAIDFERRRVTVAGKEAQVTATEYDLLAELSVNAGRVADLRFPGPRLSLLPC